METENIKVVDLYYFSGTGNTYLVIQAMKEIFERNRISVNIHPIEQKPSVVFRTDQLIGIAFPVVAFSTFPFVRQFIKDLPFGKGTNIFMVDTLGMISGGIVGPLKKVLKAKGYNPVGAREIKMPENFYPRKVSQDENMTRTQKGLESARHYAQDLCSGKTSWLRVPIISNIIWFLSGSSLVKTFLNNLGKKFTVDHKKCTKCGLCVELCPVSNISLTNEETQFKSHCEQCMRCLSFCPENAIFVPGKKYTTYKAVQAEKLLPKPQ